MVIKTVIRLAILSVIGLLHSLPLLADAPYEKYHVIYDENLRAVLKETIGILTINSGIKNGTELKTYLKTESKFVYHRTLKVKEETTPVSNYGYHPRETERGVQNYRYPIVAKLDEYLCIVYDPIESLKTWINMKEVEENFYTSIVMVDNNIGIQSSSFVDIFYFTKSGRRKLYKEPKKDADFSIISKYEHKYSLLRIIDQKGEFVKIGIVHVDFDTYEESIEPIGWIRIRDNQGMLMFWIKDVDLC